MRIAKITKFMKTAKFTIICKTIDKINEMYSKNCKADPSKVTKITKFTKIYAMHASNVQFLENKKYMLFAGLGSVRIVKNYDRGLENAARGRSPRAAFSSPRSQFFTIRTDPKPANDLFIFFLR